jgi:hypothetical protein
VANNHLRCEDAVPETSVSINVVWWS